MCEAQHAQPHRGREMQLLRPECFVADQKTDEIADAQLLEAAAWP